MVPPSLQLSWPGLTTAVMVAMVSGLQVLVVIGRGLFYSVLDWGLGTIVGFMIGHTNF